jgi:hypothetical protein
MASEKKLAAMLPIDEKINLVLPLLFLGPILFEIFLLKAPLTATTRAILTGLAVTVLFNFTHIGYTFNILTGFPEAKDWISGKFGKFSPWFWPVSMFLILLFTLFVGVGYRLIPLRGAYENIGPEVVMVIYATIINFHALTQCKGISLLYNKKLISDLNYNDLEVKSIKRHERIERNMVRLLVLFDILFGIVSYEAIHRPTGISSLHLQYGIVAISFAIVFFALFAARGIPHVKKSNKIYFMSRYLLWPFSYFSFLALFAIWSVHGLEYFFVYRKMATRTAAAGLQRRQLKIYGFVFAGLFFILGALGIESFASLVVTEWHAPSFPFQIASALAAGITTWHMLYDRYFFRFRTSLDRRVAHKLLG